MASPDVTPESQREVSVHVDPFKAGDLLTSALPPGFNRGLDASASTAQRSLPQLEITGVTPGAPQTSGQEAGHTDSSQLKPSPVHHHPLHHLHHHPLHHQSHYPLQHPLHHPQHHQPDQPGARRSYAQNGVDPAAGQVGHQSTDGSTAPASGRAESLPFGDARTQQILKETIGQLNGKSPQCLDRGIDPRLGCARCVSEFGHRAYGLPITESVANLEAAMRARNFERVPLNSDTMAHLQPGDIIIGHRNSGQAGTTLHGHSAIYVGNGRIFSNNSMTGTMTEASVNGFRQPLHNANGGLNSNGYSDVWIYRPRTGAS